MPVTGDNEGSSLCQIIKQCLGLLQVERVEAFGEPAVNVARMDRKESGSDKTDAVGPDVVGGYGFEPQTLSV